MLNNEQYPGYGDTGVFSYSDLVEIHAEDVGSPPAVPSCYQPEAFQPSTIEGLTPDMARLQRVVEKQLFIVSRFSKDSALRDFSDSMNPRGRTDVDFRWDVIEKYDFAKTITAEKAIADAKALHAAHELEVARAQQAALEKALKSAEATYAVQLVREAAVREAAERLRNEIANVYDSANNMNIVFDAEQAREEQKLLAEARRLALVAANVSMQRDITRLVVDNYLNHDELGPYIMELFDLHMVTGQEKVSLTELRETDPGLAVKKIKQLCGNLILNEAAAETRHEIDNVVPNNDLRSLPAMTEVISATEETLFVKPRDTPFSALDFMADIDKKIAAGRRQRQAQSTVATEKSVNEPVTSVTITVGNIRRTFPVTSSTGVQHVTNV